jgi:hypothetical protein
MKSWKLTELKFIRDNIHLSDKQLADYFVVNETTIDGTRQRHGILRPTDGKFKKGQVPHNKGKHYNAGGRSIATRFKKGQPPPNAFRKIGDVFTILDRYKKPYQFIKLEHNRKYPYGRYVWEQHFGQNLSKDDIIRYRNGNPLDCQIENLEKVTRRENAQRNINREKAKRTIKQNKASVLKGLMEMGFSVNDFLVKPKKQWRAA